MPASAQPHQNGHTPPAGLTATDWQQITAQLPPHAYTPTTPLAGIPLIQQAYFKASNPDPSDSFGVAVAVSGNTVVIGAEEEDSNATGINGNQANNDADHAGAAYVFVRNGSTWTQQAYLKASNTEADDRFGYAVAISDDTIVIGAAFEDSNATTINGNQSNNGAPNAGAAYVYVRNGVTWSQQAYLKASNSNQGDFFGLTVAVSHDTLVVGASFEDSNATGVNGNQANNDLGQAGAAYIFVRNGNSWSQQAYLKASNTDMLDQFGYSVAVSGDTVVVGAKFEDSNAMGVNGNQDDDTALDSGAVYIFVRNGITWSQQVYLKASNTVAYYNFGHAVAISGNTVVVGSPRESSDSVGVNGDQTNVAAPDAGAAYVFIRNGVAWSQQAYLKASNTGASDSFGKAVAISGDLIAIGASDEDSNATGINGNGANNSSMFAGAAYTFSRSGNSWNEPDYVKASNTDMGNYFGISVAVSDEIIVVGAYSEDSNATGVNGNQTNNSAGNSGAVYTFVAVNTVYLPLLTQ